MSLKKKFNSNIHESGNFRSWMQKYHGMNISEDSINIKDYEVQYAARWQTVNELLKKLQAELVRDNFNEVASKIKTAYDKMVEGSNDITSLISQAIKDLPQEEPKTTDTDSQQLTGDAVPIVPQDNGGITNA